MIFIGIVFGSLVMLGIIGVVANATHESKMMEGTRLTLAEETDYEIRHPQGRTHA